LITDAAVVLDLSADGQGVRVAVRDAAVRLLRPSHHCAISLRRPSSCIVPDLDHSFSNRFCSTDAASFASIHPPSRCCFMLLITAILTKSFASHSHPRAQRQGSKGRQ